MTSEHPTPADWLSLAVLGTVLGVFGEVLFTGIMDLISPGFLKSWNVHHRQPAAAAPPEWRAARDRRLVGYSFLWMIPVYATAFVLYVSLHEAAVPWPWLARIAMTTAYFYVLEAAYGLAFRLVLGKCPWDYSASRLSFLGVIRWDFAPFWIVLAVLLDLAWSRILELTHAIAKIFLA